MLLPLAAGLAGLIAVTVAVGAAAGLGQVRAALTATARAILQLTLLGVVLAAVLRTPRLAPLYLGVVLTVAAWTSGRRLGGGRAALLSAAAAITAGAGSTAVVVFGSHALDLTARTAVPFVAQVVGGTMTATTVAGQRLVDDVTAGWDEVEAWLALGARPPQAVARMARHAAGRALVPALDQTRNVGLVVLPGAYVGLLLAGASPVQAGRLQLLVLVAMLAAETVAAVVVTRLLSASLGGRRPPGVPG